MKPTIKHLKYYGDVSFKNQTRIGPVPDDFTLNTPVGITMDRFQNVWLCDTGNSRVLIFDADLANILHVIKAAPMKTVKRSGKKRSSTETAVDLLLPFHLYPHPEENRMLLTDMGNKRVVLFDYDFAGGKYTMGNVTSFGYPGDGLSEYRTAEDKKSDLPFALDDPNGITMVPEADGRLYIYVNDEFQFDPADPGQLNRCVKFTEGGKYVGDFRQVRDHGAGKTHDLIWPQGLASDSRGNLYIANTGRYEIVKCHYTQDAAEGSTLLHSFGDPRGVGSMNILRSVSVIEDRAFVPDQKANAISVYDLSSGKQTFITGMMPTLDHGEGDAGTLSDLAFTMAENSSLSSPYQVAKGEKEKIYFITEPFISRVVKIKIPTLEKDCQAVLLRGLGDRRNRVEKRGATSQFNCVTSVAGIGEIAGKPSAQAPVLPDYLSLNPLYSWYAAMAEAGVSAYEFWYDNLFAPLFPKGDHALDHTKYNVDAGNWIIKAYSEHLGDFHQESKVLKGFYIPGDLGMAAYTPAKTLPGQICPGTPLIFVTNFTMGVVTPYQSTPDGKLINYGLPFGFRGSYELGGMLGPQGLAVNADGEIYIADSLNHRISKWQVLPTGQIVFIGNFGWEGTPEFPEEKNFYPTDVAIDAHNRVFVTDQFNNRIRVFDRDGNGLWCYGTRGYCDESNIKEKYDNFMLPASLSIDGNHLIINDLVNRYLKVFTIGEETLSYVTGKALFKDKPENGGVWMPFLIHAQDRQIYVPDSTYNIVNVYEY